MPSLWNKAVVNNINPENKIEPHTTPVEFNCLPRYIPNTSVEIIRNTSKILAKNKLLFSLIIFILIDSFFIYYLETH